MAAWCRKCDHRWTSLTECHCSVCHRHFVGIRAFDSHRKDIRGKGTCLDPATIMGPGPDKVPLFNQIAGVWTTAADRKPRGIALTRMLERYEREQNQ